jgi:hypothetical protein
MNLGGLRSEIERVEAANKPLPLPEHDRALDEEEGKGKGKEREEDNPLGPL